MTDKELIKALAYCEPNAESKKLALDLIVRQQKEINKLKDMISENEGVLPKYETLMLQKGRIELAQRLEPELKNELDELFSEVRETIYQIVKRVVKEMESEDNVRYAKSTQK